MTGDKVLARRLVEEDAELERLFRSFKMALEREIARSPRNAAPLNRLMLVGVYLRDIGSRVVSACHTLLYSPPASECSSVPSVPACRRPRAGGRHAIGRSSRRFLHERA